MLKLDYSFAKHETFHIRTGWLRKGLDAIKKDNHIFLERMDAMDELGIGSNMIKSLRYWLQAVGLTYEDYNSSRQRVQFKSTLAEKILDYDEFFEDPATFWLLHFNIGRDKELATTWYWFFNHFNYLEFDKELFVDMLIKYIERNGEKPPAESSLKSDFDVLTRMYSYDPKENNSPEDSLESPFKELKLITKIDNRTYKLNRPTLDNLPVEVFLYCLLDSLEDIRSVNVEELLNKENSIGRVFKLNMNLLYDYIEKLEELGYLRLDKHAGLNSIQLKVEDKEKVLADYYQSKTI